MRKNAPRPAPRRMRAFTLIELLVSMTVLSIIVLLISQLFSSATSVATSNRKRLDADAQARLVFDRLALDFGKMIKRNDVDYIFAKIDGTNDAQSENDKMFFYSEAPAFFNTTDTSTTSSPTPDPRNTVALVGYRINAAYQLERLGKQLSWDGVPEVNGTGTTKPGGMVFLSPGTSENPDPNSTMAKVWQTTIGQATDKPPYSPQTYDSDYRVLAEQVFRLEFCFQLRDGSFSPIPVCPLSTIPAEQNNFKATTAPTKSDSGPTNYVVGSRWYNTIDGRGFVCVNNASGAAVWNILGLQDVRAVVVGLAILDGTSAGVLPTGTPVTINGRQFRAPNLTKLSEVLADVHPKDATSPGSPSQDPTVPSIPTPAPTGTPVPIRLMAEAWNNRTKKSDFPQVANVPATVAAQVRVYQRTFVLNNQ